MHIQQGLYCTFTVLDIKVYYHLQNAIFHKAAGRKEYCIPRVCNNKPDIQHSKGVTLYSLHLHTKLCQGFEDTNNALQEKSLWQSILGYSACMHFRTTTLLASNLRAGWVMAIPEVCSYLQANVQDRLASSLLNNNTGLIYTDALKQWPHFRNTFVQIYTLSIACNNKATHYKANSSHSTS